MVLTVRAMPMPAGVRDPFLVGAARALHLHLDAGLGTAALDGGEGAQLVGGETIPVLAQEVALEGIDDAGQANHLTVPPVRQKPSIKVLIRSMA